MSALSKQFVEFSKHQTCANFIHPNETCTQQFFDMVWKNFFTVGQYYLPTLVIPLLLNIKSLNYELFVQALIDYGKCILIANWLSTMTIESMCWFRKIFGKFYFHWFLRIPTLIGTLMFNFYPLRIKQWQSTGMLNMYIETIIKKSDNRIINSLRGSRIFGTLMFMGLSSVIMAGFKITGINRFWFTSMPKLDKNKIQPCVHTGMCSNYIKNEFFSSSKLAFILALLKFIISNYKLIKLSHPALAFKLLFKKLDYNMIAFTISYNTLFKLLYCWFNNKTGENTVNNVMAAGFLAGISYTFYPIYMVFTYGITASLQMGWLMYSKYIASRTNNSNYNNFINLSTRFVDFINKLPIATIVMIVCCVQLFQNRFQYPYATPIYVHKFMSLGTAKRADQIGLRFSNIILGFSNI